MSSGQRQLSVILDYTDRLSGNSGRTIKSLTGIEKGAKGAAKAVEQLNKALGRNVRAQGIDVYGRRLGKLRTELRSSLKDAELVRTSFGRGFDTKGIEAAISKTRQLQRTNQSLVRGSSGGSSSPRRRGYRPGEWMKDSDAPPDWRRQLPGDTPEPRPRRRRDRADRLGFGERIERLDDALQTPGQVAAAWRERADSLTPYVDETKRLLLARERFKVIGLPEADNREAFEAVARTVKQIKGLSVAETTESMLDLVGALGDVKQAASMLPLASKYKLGFDVLFGDQMAEAERSAQVLNSFKSLEYLGVTQKGPEETSRMLDTISQIGNSTGGRVTPGEILTMLRRGKVASRGLSDEGLRNISTLIEDLSAPTVGQSLMSLYQGVVGGQLDQAPARLHQKYELIDPGKIEYTKAGILKKVMPGGHKLAPLLQEDPLKFADALTEALKKGGVDVSNENELRGVLSQMFPNRNAFTLVDSLITQRAQTEKESKRSRTSKGALGTADQLQGSELMRLKEYEAAMTNFKAEVGLPLLKMTADAAKGLRPVLELAAEYPKTAAGILLVTKSFGGLVQTTNLLYRGGSGLYEFFSGIRSGAGGAAAAVEGVTGRATGLRGVLSLLNNPVAISLGLTAASVFTIGEIKELYGLMEEKKKADAAAAAANGGNLGAIDRARAEFAAEGKPVPRELWKMQAGGALAKLNPNNQLREALGGWTAGALVKDFFQGGLMGADVNPYKNVRRFEPSSAARVFKERAPELGQPEIMAEFRRMVDGLRLPSEQRATLDKGLAHIFPESFQKSTQMLAEEFLKTTPTVTSAGDALKKMIDPTLGLAAGLREAQTASYLYAARVNGLEIRVPSIVLPPAGGASGSASGGGAKSGYKFGIDPLNPFPQSAVGSVIHSDGLVNLHKGNVVMPARLSRRSPGDWLDAAEAVRGGRRSPAELRLIFGRGAGESAPDGHTARPDAAAESAGAPDYSLFQAGGGGREITVNVGGVHVAGGADPRETGAAVAAEVERQVREALARLAALESDVYDPRFVANMTARELNWQRERA